VDYSLPVEDRLIEQGSEMMSLRLKMKKLVEDKKLQDYTFTPSINLESRREAQNSVPIYRRLGKLERHRRNKLRQMRLLKEQQMSHSFNPEINETSVLMAENGRKGLEVGLPVEDRLRSHLGSNILRKMRRRAEVEQEMKAEYTFNPKLSENSKRIIEEKYKQDNGSGNQDFYERQIMLEETKKAKRRARQADEIRRLGCTFRPDIGNSNEILENSHTKSAVYENESRADTYERLAFKDREDIEANREILEEEIYAGLDFKPKINRMSKMLAKGKRRDIYDLVYDENREMAKMEQIQLDEERFQEACTFTPQKFTKSSNKWQLPENHIDLSDTKSLIKKLEDKRKRKESRIQKKKAEKEFEDIKHCTFAPDTYKMPVKAPNGPVLVRGLSKFMEKKRLAKKLQDEKRMREERAFGLKHVGDRQPFTIPRPFKLSDNTSHKKKQRDLQRVLEKERRKECTFKPRTLEGSNRKLIRKLLDHGVVDKSPTPP